jgi:hypothetical protein
MFYLFNSQSKEQFGPYSELELWKQIDAFEEANHSLLFVWSAGWTNWKGLEDFKATNRKGRTFDIEDTSVVRHIPKADINKRKFTRFAYRMKCTILSSGTIFETYSVDISLGGIQVEHAIPAQMVKEKCTIEIEGPDGVGQVRFTLNLAARDEAKYFYFSNFVPTEVKTLEKWLTALSNTTISRPRFKA